jgi:hypothetical protein
MTAITGPIPISAGLEGILRLRRALAELVPESREDHPPLSRDLSLQYLDEVESELGVSLPYDVIALAVLRVPLFVRATGLSAPHLASVVRDCAGDFGPPRGWVAVGSFGERAMARDVELVSAGHDTLLCVSRSCAREGDCEVRTAVDGQASPPQRLSAFLRERVARRWGLQGSWMTVLRRAADDTRPLEDEYVARIVDDRPAPAPVVRVAHPKFGEGTVVRVDGDKLEIAFDSGEKKTLLRQFVRDAR